MSHVIEVRVTQHSRPLFGGLLTLEPGCPHYTTADLCSRMQNDFNGRGGYSHSGYRLEMAMVEGPPAPPAATAPELGIDTPVHPLTASAPAELPPAAVLQPGEELVPITSLERPTSQPIDSTTRTTALEQANGEAPVKPKKKKAKAPAKPKQPAKAKAEKPIAVRTKKKSAK